MKDKGSDSIYQTIVETLTIFIKAVRKAQRENLRLGLPNVYCEGGRIFYQLPNGRITDVLPKNLL
jgi:hypothetical protein